jgi:hypothetical protein
LTEIDDDGRWHVLPLNGNLEPWLRSGLIVSIIFLQSCAATYGPSHIRVLEDAIEIPATVHKDGFENHSMPGYHFMTWEGGRASKGALFLTPVTDVQVLDALEALGAEPGNALGIDTWDERNDPDSRAPDKVIQGQTIEVLVRVPGEDRPLGLDEILEDPGGRGFEMRFGGHRENIPKWKSGCVVCLYSCPGSKVGNASYTVRDFVQNKTRFTVRPGILPEDGSRVTLIFRLVEETPQ